MKKKDLCIEAAPQRKQKEFFVLHLFFVYPKIYYIFYLNLKLFLKDKHEESFLFIAKHVFNIYVMYFKYVQKCFIAKSSYSGKDES
jgi:hypothetical protein